MITNKDEAKPLTEHISCDFKIVRFIISMT